ncbi:MAG: lytic murein transglycosylase [Alphaproteobacteria bacterium]|nr:lytic murein transglycosylase [Alphaproteobacteria bacterium]
MALRRGLIVPAFVMAFAGGLAGLWPSDPARAAEPFPQWLDGVREEARAAGISEEVIRAALTDFEPIARVIELDRSQPEGRLTLAQYLDRVISDARIRTGRARLAEHRAALEAVAEEYGVQPRFIVSLWGIETSYGRITGGYPVVQSLATLAHDGRRSDFFRKELLNALRILDEGHIEADKMLGSWAGAMGQSQFMPSSFLRLAVDGDGDGRKDIWTNQADVFASMANYLKRSGWRDDITWGRKAALPDGFSRDLIGLKVKRPLSFWQGQGVRRQDGRDLPVREIEASVIQPDGPGTQAYIVYENFRTTLKWNRSTYFATAVGTLADALWER